MLGGVCAVAGGQLLGGFCLEPEHLVYVCVWPVPPTALAVDEQGCRECWKSHLVSNAVGSRLQQPGLRLNAAVGYS